MLQEVHPLSDELEGYFLETSSNADLEKVEEHLLICERCQNELALTGQHVRTRKRAAASPEKESGYGLSTSPKTVQYSGRCTLGPMANG
jgi:hypothetical protein